MQFVAVNCSCNCLSPKVLVLSKNWPHYQEFVGMLKEELGMHYLLYIWLYYISYIRLYQGWIEECAIC